MKESAIRTFILAKVAVSGIVAAMALILNAHAAIAECGRAAAAEARPVYRDVEAHPPRNVAEAHRAYSRLNSYDLQPCPDENGAGHDADFAVFFAWRSALDARAMEYITGAGYPDRRCHALRHAERRRTLLYAYRRVFTTGVSSTKASPDAIHVANLVRGEGRAVGISLPPPYTVAKVDAPRSLAPDAVRAHLPTGLYCGPM
jgi:hypothetical protein